MSKRPYVNDNSNSTEIENKKKINIWNKEVASETPLTPPQTPNSTSKYNYNIWNKSETVANSMPIKIHDLEVGMCLNRPIRFRASFKSDKKPSKNGDMFHFHGTDGTDEIQVTVFPQQMSFFDVIQFNQAYELINFNVKLESKDFPVFVGNGKYISLLSSSKINKIDNDSVPEIQFNFIQIEKIKTLEVNSKCDIVAIIAENWGSEIVGQNKIKHDLSITDESKECIILTLWGDRYEKFDFVGTTVLIHNGIVKDYNGARTITCAANTLLWHDPEIDIAKNLKSWFDMEIMEMKEMNKSPK